MKLRALAGACALGVAALMPSVASASVVWTGSSGNLAAEAEFSVSGSNLVVN